MKKILNNTFFRRTTDILLSPITLVGALWFKFVRTGDSSSMPVSEKIFMSTGTLPVNDHYYQPLINPSKHLTVPLDKKRNLPGIDWNIRSQLDLLGRFTFQQELSKIPREKSQAGKFEYYYNNHSFCPGDAEFLYNIIRYFKPGKFIEIGCGFSTMVATLAHKKNATETGAPSCEHICIEPYEMPWLEQLNVSVIRKKVEDTDPAMFAALGSNDILFIDSSHIIRPQGDVLFEFLEILPMLKPGVIVHVHDVFTPRDYPREWIVNKHIMWNEQYLLEAFLCNNKEFSIIGALNLLKHEHAAEFSMACPESGKIPDDEPGSFWFVKN